MVTPQLCFLVCGDTCEDADTFRVGYDREGRAPTQCHLPAHREDSEQPKPSHTGDAIRQFCGSANKFTKAPFPRKAPDRSPTLCAFDGLRQAWCSDERSLCPGARPEDVCWGRKAPSRNSRNPCHLLTRPAASTHDPSRAAANPAGAHTLLHRKVAGSHLPFEPLPRQPSAFVLP